MSWASSNVAEYRPSGRGVYDWKKRGDAQKLLDKRMDELFRWLAEDNGGRRAPSMKKVMKRKPAKKLTKRK